MSASHPQDAGHCPTGIPRAGEEARPAADVLVVDDEPAVRQLACDVLGQAGFTVVGTGDPHEALRIAQTMRVGVLLTDVVMPEMSGPELADRVRAACPHTTVVFMSGNMIDETIRRGAFLAKPFTLERLVATIRDLLATAPGGGTDRSTGEERHPTPT